MKIRLTLARLEARIGFADNVNPTFTTHDLAVRVPVFK